MGKWRDHIVRRNNSHLSLIDITKGVIYYLRSFNLLGHSHPSSFNNETDMAATSTRISSASYYSEYHGHKLHHLETLYHLLREGSDALLWTAGDSSLDNKCVSIYYTF